jgi:hypothetical protein
MAEIDFQKLADPFPPEEIEWRVGRSGVGAKGPWAKVLAYLTSRAVMHRLDTVVGPANWKDDYTKGPEGGVLCGISIRCGGDWVTKWDGAENSQIESVKGGLSDSFKRAAVKWGLGRYLYRLEEGWAEIADDNDRDAYQGEAKDKSGTKVYFRWYPPKLPDWALPQGYNAKPLVADPKHPANAPLTRKEVADHVNGESPLYADFAKWLNEQVESKVYPDKEAAKKAAMTYANELNHTGKSLQQCRIQKVFDTIKERMDGGAKKPTGNVLGVKQPAGTNY